jgi:hypothetical protein
MSSNSETDVTKTRQQASAALRKAALNEEAKTYLLSNPLLFNLLLKAARRYIGGETLEQALATKKPPSSRVCYQSRVYG